MNSCDIIFAVVKQFLADYVYKFLTNVIAIKKSSIDMAFLGLIRTSLVPPLSSF